MRGISSPLLIVNQQRMEYLSTLKANVSKLRT